MCRHDTSSVLFFDRSPLQDLDSRNILPLSGPYFFCSRIGISFSLGVGFANGIKSGAPGRY